MQKMLKIYICLALLASMVALEAANNVAPLISPRSRSVDSALELSGWAHQVNLYGKEGIYGSLAITPQYTRTFNENKTIIPCLFNGDVDCRCEKPTLRVSGKCRTDRKATDWLADYFGLPSDFESEVSFDPSVQTFSVDFNFYLGLNEWWKNAYFRIHAPVEYARYRLNFCEKVIEAGTLGHDEGYFSDAFIPRDNLLNKFEDFIVNCKVPTLDGQFDVDDTTARDGNVEFEKLNCAKISGCKRLKETKLSDLQMALGWNFFQEENYHMGILIRASAPTGTRPEGKYLFEPIVGNGHHWELGGGVTMHRIFWESEDEDASFGLWIDANITHLFNARQHRFFDLVNNGGNSRYMLAAKMNTRGVENLFASPDETGATPVPTAPIAQFARVFRPVANLTCCDVDVSIGVQGDVTAMFNYTKGNFSWDVGYNFWGRSCEKIRLNCNCPCPLEKEPNTWVLKGDSHVIGFTPADNGTDLGTLGVNAPIALSVSDSKATIHLGTNIGLNEGCTAQDATQQDPDTRSNPIIDNNQFAFYNNVAPATNRMMLGVGLNNSNDNNLIGTSKEPLFLSIDDVDLCGAATRGMSHKIFTHISYIFEERENGWVPYFGVGAKAEFAQNKECCSKQVDGSCSDTGSGCCCCKDRCESCIKCNFSEWGVWAKGGISFD